VAVISISGVQFVLYCGDANNDALSKHLNCSSVSDECRSRAGRVHSNPSVCSKLNSSVMADIKLYKSKVYGPIVHTVQTDKLTVYIYLCIYLLI